MLTQNIAAAKKLVQQAGDTGKTITIGTSSQLANIAAVTGAYQAAAQAIGLKVALKSVSAQNYINFFTSASARAGIDGFLTVNYGDYADPAALLSTFVLPGGSQNYNNFNDPKITAALEQARSTANPDKRAALVAEAEKLTMQQLPWIPDVQPTSLLMLGKGLTGAVGVVRLHVRPVGQPAGRYGERAADAMRWRFFARRLAMLVASLLVASFVIFAALYLAPGNPIAALSGGRPLPPSSIRILDAALPPERAVPRPVLVLARQRAAREPGASRSRCGRTCPR